MGVKLFLIRHGQTDSNVEGRYQGTLDTSLTETGIEQAIAAKKYLSKVKFSNVYSSPLKRAIQSAEIIADDCGPKISVREDLREKPEITNTTDNHQRTGQNSASMRGRLSIVSGKMAVRIFERPVGDGLRV